MKLISLLKSATFAAAMVVGIAAAQAQAPTSTIESRLSTALKDLGFADGKLPVLKPAFGNYVDAVQVGNTLYLSSAAPQKPDGQFAKGRVPSEVSVEDAQKAAKLAWARSSRRRSSPTTPRSSTPARSCSSRCSARPASTPARPMASLPRRSA